MPNILSVGVSQRIDQLDCGSLDVSCSVALDPDEALISPGYLQTMKQAYVACQQAVANESQRHQSRMMG